MANNTHGFIGDDLQKAADDFYGLYAYVMSKIGRQRAWPPMNRGNYEMMCEDGSLLLGRGNTHSLLHISVGTLPHLKAMRSLELLGNVVTPAIKKAVPAK